MASDEERHTKFYFKWWIPLILWHIALSVLSLYCDIKRETRRKWKSTLGLIKRVFLQPEKAGGVMGVVRWEGVLIGKSRRGEGGGGVM